MMTYKQRVQAARQADIPEICRKMGVEIVPEKYDNKDEYRIPGYGGLLINGNAYYHHGNEDGRIDGQPAGEKNNAISFVMYFFHKSFAEALDIILGDGYGFTRHDTSGYKPAAVKQHAEVTYTPEKSGDYRCVMAYLCQTRGLTVRTVQECIDRELLYQDTRRNAVFVCRDEQGKIIGYEIKGTNSTTPFKRASGNAVFRFQCGDAPTGVIAFESAIDLLSYYDMFRQKLTHHLLLSMGGCRPEILQQVTDTHPDYMVAIATDNDAKGNAFWETYQAAHPDAKRVASRRKDWNEDLTSRIGKE